MIAPVGMPRRGTAGSCSISWPCCRITEPLRDSKHSFLQPMLGNGWKTASWGRDPPYPSLAGKCSRHNFSSTLAMLCHQCRALMLDKTNVVSPWGASLAI